MEINQYTFSHKELVELMIKKAGLHEGRWMLMTTFGFTAGNFGPSDDQMIPGIVAAVQSLGIQRADQNAPSSLVVDAAESNPKA